MDDWIKWAIPIVAVVMWIVLNLLRVPQQQAGRKQPRRPPERPNPRPVEQQPLTDLDRFLQDAQRRRSEAEKRPDAKRTATPPLPAPAQAISREDRPPAERPVTQSTRTAPTPNRKDETPWIDRAESSGADSWLRQLQELEESQDDIPMVVPVTPRRSAVDVGKGQGRSPGGAGLRKVAAAGITLDIVRMLQNPESARAAYVMREILDRPVALRERRR